MRFTKRTASAALTVLLVVVAGAVLWRCSTDAAAPPLSIRDAQEAVRDAYAGEISGAVLQGDAYRIELETERGRYGFTVDARDGAILSIRRLEAYDPPDTPSPGGADKGDDPDVSPDLELSEQEAAALALAAVPGEVQDIDEEEGEGGRYFLVEIDAADGREAIVQVHAISGEVRSIAWDDDDDEDEDEEED
ncbi:PepSY domain-containing protein [Paenibacillus sp. IB182496]|uniref:PepSY domain-containing protein n=1 Tax=Paenibacillus sabuli TaxID=2772509 RepID=A0A927GTL9_9BACL|nr:PepSY domain-containing protein [Paenibacillus sabuli]MBD2847728.1 PepSY domain-containing protein [Paenibacillus sabuli]